MGMVARRTEHRVVRVLGSLLLAAGVALLLATAVVPGLFLFSLVPPFLAIGLLLLLFGTYGGRPRRG